MCCDRVGYCAVIALCIAKTALCHDIQNCSRHEVFLVQRPLMNVCVSANYF